MTDDSLPFDRCPDHEAGHVGEEEEGNVEGIAGPNEPGRLVGGVDEQDPPFLSGLARNDPDRLAIEPGQCGDQLPRPVGLDLEERVAVHQHVDQIPHVERHVLVFGDDFGDRAIR